MNWYCVRDGKPDGPHTEEALKNLLRSGAINAATLVWREGMDTWEPLPQAAPHLLPAAPSLKPVHPQNLREGVQTVGGDAELRRLLKVAKAQRGVNLCILLSLICYAVILFASSAVPKARDAEVGILGILVIVSALFLLGVVIMQVIYVYRLASALGSGVPIVWVLGILLLSCIGLLLLLILSSKATRQLREAGFQVGLLGGNPKDVESRMDRSGA